VRESESNCESYSTMRAFISFSVIRSLLSVSRSHLSVSRLVIERVTLPCGHFFHVLCVLVDVLSLGLFYTLSGCKGCVTLPCGHCFHVLCARKSERPAIIEKVPHYIYIIKE
jgi:hypothetical protein